MSRRTRSTSRTKRPSGGPSRRSGRSDGIDILVVAAGMNFPERRLEQLTAEGWDAMISVNLSGAFYAIRAALPYLRASRRSRRPDQQRLGTVARRLGPGLPGLEGRDGRARRTPPASRNTQTACASPRSCQASWTPHPGQPPRAAPERGPRRSPSNPRTWRRPASSSPRSRRAPTSPS